MVAWNSSQPWNPFETYTTYSSASQQMRSDVHLIIIHDSDFPCSFDLLDPLVAFVKRFNCLHAEIIAAIFLR
jgi:hypothetical protein